MARESEFLELDDDALHAVVGPNSRHVALIEDAFKVLIEAPGGGVSINGGARDRANAKQVIETLADRVAKRAEVNEADVRAAIGSARTGVTGGGRRVDPMALPIGKRGAIVPKTDAQARYLDVLANHELSFGVGPAGTGKTFLAAAYGASLLRRGQQGGNQLHRVLVQWCRCGCLCSHQIQWVPMAWRAIHSFRGPLRSKPFMPQLRSACQRSSGWANRPCSPSVTAPMAVTSALRARS